MGKHEIRVIEYPLGEWDRAMKVAQEMGLRARELEASRKFCEEVKYDYASYPATYLVQSKHFQSERNYK